MYEVVRINGRSYYKGKDFEEVKVWTPTNNEPYWQIDFVINDKVEKRIKATGQVEYVIHYED